MQSSQLGKHSKELDLKLIGDYVRRWELTVPLVLSPLRRGELLEVTHILGPATLHSDENVRLTSDGQAVSVPPVEMYVVSNVFASVTLPLCTHCIKMG